MRPPGADMRGFFEPPTINSSAVFYLMLPRCNAHNCTLLAGARENKKMQKQREKPGESNGDGGEVRAYIGMLTTFNYIGIYNYKRNTHFSADGRNIGDYTLKVYVYR